jgi:hypothetical protein
MRAFLLALLFASSAFGQDSMLIGGREVQPGEYPEVIRIRQCQGTRCAYCTASVIGPKAILTAGHCTTDNGEIVPVSEELDVEFMHAQAVYKAKCRQSPLYRAPQTEDHDMALCVVDQVVAPPYASVAAQGPKLQEIVGLMGYGCVNPRKPDGSGPSGGNDGKLRVGEAPVYQLPAGKDNWYYTRGTTALCSGDSGGPSYKRIVEAGKEHHYVLGVNSRGNLKDTSLLTAVYIQKSKDFIASFAAEYALEVCGYNKDCDGAEPPEPGVCAAESENLQKARLLLDFAVDKLRQCLVTTTVPEGYGQLPN